MKAFVALPFVAFILCSSATASAEGECDKYTTSYDKTYCFAKLFVESDKELNAVYKELKDALKDDVKQQLTTTQRGWIKYRDTSCSVEGTIDVDCNYRVNRDRTEYLRDRLRECKAGTCRNEMISQKSWK
jgi:uncharacterized protein YecT (DUF1311 family)